MLPFLRKVEMLPISMPAGATPPHQKAGLGELNLKESGPLHEKALSRRKGNAMAEYFPY